MFPAPSTFVRSCPLRTLKPRHGDDWGETGRHYVSRHDDNAASSQILQLGKLSLCLAFFLRLVCTAPGPLGVIEHSFSSELDWFRFLDCLLKWRSCPERVRGFGMLTLDFQAFPEKGNQPLSCMVVSSDKIQPLTTTSPHSPTPQYSLHPSLPSSHHPHMAPFLCSSVLDH